MPITPPLSELWRAMRPTIASHVYNLLCSLWLLARRWPASRAGRGLMIGLGVAFVFTLSPDRILGHRLWAQW